MIRVTCSKLEDIRQNPKAFAQQLKSNNDTGRGSYGMLQCWQTFVRASHTGELEVSGAIKGLQQRFMKYADNAVNKKKQEFLIDRFSPYLEDFKSRNYQYLGSNKQIFWKMIPEVALTGHTPNLVSNENGFAAYFYTENPVSWEMQLRFPLIQYYLAENVFNTSVENVEIGTYCLKAMTFNLKQYSESEIEHAISETKEIFTIIKNEYNSK